MRPSSSLLLCAGLLPSACGDKAIDPINKCVVPLLLSYIRCGNLIPSYCLPGLEAEIVDFCGRYFAIAVPINIRPGAETPAVRPPNIGRRWDPPSCPPVDQRWLVAYPSISSVCTCLKYGGKSST
jgi:hypothetical protein